MRPDPRGSRTYRDYLRMLQRQRGLAQFEFAKLVGRSASWYSQILNGRRRLRPELAEEIAKSLGLTERERTELLSLVEAELGPSHRTRERARNVLDGMRTPDPGPSSEEAIRHDVIRKWYVGAVLELARCEDFVPEPSWIAAVLRPRISLEEARSAMDCLRRHRLLDEEYRPVDDAMIATEKEIPDGAETLLAGEHYEQTLNMAKGALRTVRPSDRLYLGATVALSESDYQNLREYLVDLVGPALCGASKELPNRVYQFTLSLFPVSLYSDSSVDPRQLPGDLP